MSKPGLRDADARRRIGSSFERNLLVEAGAGSGKTHEMAVRMAAGIAAGALVIEHMAAVTFTRKAASELRGRFQEALETELRASDEGSERAARIREALGKLEQFFAGTIHAFCAHLLRQHPVEAGLSPVFDEVDEVQDTLQRNQAWRDYLRHARAIGHPQLQELRDGGVKQKQLDSAFATICEHEDVVFPPGDAERPAVRDLWKKVDAFRKEIAALLPDPIDPATTCEMQKRWPRFLRVLGMARRRSDSGEALASVLALWDRDFDNTHKWWPGKKVTAEKAEQIAADFRADIVASFMKAWRQHLYRVTVTLMNEAREYASKERRRRNTLNYNDLLVLTARLLRERPDVRARLQSKFRWLFVDEFQDTDPLQAELIFLLAGEPPASGGWRDARLRPGALFVVGDPKQSIYRFRRADIDIYNQVKARIGGAPDGRVELLTSNFRSAPELCDWANDVFKRQFPAEADPWSPAFAPLDPRPDTKKVPQAGIYTLTVNDKWEAACVAEAEAIARYIRAEIDGGRHRAGDFLILTWRKKPLSIYMDALERLSVPVEVSGAGAFAESPEVAALAQLLRLLADPQDAAELIGVLRGPFFGVSDRELWEWRQADGAFSIFADVRDKAGRVGQALATLRGYYRTTRVMPVAAALEHILDQSGYLAMSATSPDGVQAGDLVHAIDRVRRVTESGGTLAEAAEFLAADQDAADVESLPLEPGRSDVVRLMNLHKAKGLEAKVVFLADPSSGVSDNVSRRIVRDGDTALGWFAVDERKEGERRTQYIRIAEPVGWDDHVALEQPFLQAEQKRLLYVAATRAAEMLIVGRCAIKSGAWSPLEPFLAGAKELKIPAAPAAGVKWKADVSPKARAKAAEHRGAAHAAARQASWTAASVTGEAKHIAKLARVAQAAGDDPTRVVTADTRERRADAGMAWGTLVHGLLEHAMRHDKVDDADLRRLAMWLTMESQELRPIIDEAIATVKEVMQSDFWREAKSAEHLVETPFAVQTSKRDVLFGMIDLMFASKDGWKLVDYKTDATMPAGGDPAYAYQLKAYEDAMKRCRVPTSGAVLHPVRRGS